MMRDRRWSEDLRDAFDEEALARTWAGVLAEDEARARRAARVRAGVVVVAAAAAIALWAVPAREPVAPAPAPAATPGPLARLDGEELGRLASGEGVSFDDGSRIEIDEGGEIETLVNDGQLVVLHLVRGGARFSVHPGGPRRWRIEGNGVTVEVVGTELSVVREGETVRVRVEHGVVLVRGDHVPDGVQRVAAGESILVDPTPPAAVDPAPIAPAPEPRSPRPARTESISVARGLLDEADRARLEGRASDALLILERIEREEPDAPEAPFATLDRVRLLLHLGRTQEAHDALEALLARPLPDSLRRTAEAVRDSMPTESP